MTYWQAAGIVVGSLVIIVGSIMGAAFALWRRAERRDGLR